MTSLRSVFRARTRQEFLLVLLLFCGLQVSLQAANFAFTSEFARTYDEAAHYVTGLMVRDFIAGLDWSSPMSFAEDYYFHYPKVALGHWPPVFYLIQSGWTLLFTTSRLSLMLLMAALTTSLAATVYLALRRELNLPTALGASLLLLAAPLTQTSSSVVMAEIPLALLALLAALSFGRFFDTQRWQWSVSFAAFATLAILTKANALALGLLPLVALTVSRRFGLARRLSFWFPAFLAAAVCAPWYWITLKMLKNGPLERSPRWSYTFRAVPTFSSHLLEALGLGIGVLVLLGIIDKVVVPAWRKSLQGKWLALASLMISILLFHWIVPADFDSRHMYLALPPAFCFLGAGIWRLAEALPSGRWGTSSRVVLVLAVTTVLFFLQTFSIPLRQWRGFGSPAEDLLAQETLADSVFLVSSDPAGEGALISEIARRERRPGHVVLRGSKVLSKSSWSGRRYRPLFETTEELMQFLSDIPVGMVMLDRSVPPTYLAPDHLLLRETLAAYPENWTLTGSYPLVRNGILHAAAVETYLQVSHRHKDVGSIRLDLTEMLGRSIERVPEVGPDKRQSP